MRILLDTQYLIWALDDPAMAQPARPLTADPVLARYSELVWLQPS